MPTVWVNGLPKNVMPWVCEKLYEKFIEAAEKIFGSRIPRKNFLFWFPQDLWPAEEGKEFSIFCVMDMGTPTGECQALAEEWMSLIDKMFPQAKVIKCDIMSYYALSGCAVLNRL